MAVVACSGHLKIHVKTVIYFINILYRPLPWFVLPIAIYKVDGLCTEWPYNYTEIFKNEISNKVNDCFSFKKIKKSGEIEILIICMKHYKAFFLVRIYFLILKTLIFMWTFKVAYRNKANKKINSSSCMIVEYINNVNQEIN